MRVGLVLLKLTKKKILKELQSCKRFKTLKAKAQERLPKRLKKKERRRKREAKISRRKNGLVKITKISSNKNETIW